MKLSEMRQILEQRNLKLTKSMGQNFLHDGNQLNRIVDAADLTPEDRVLEIGPGLGPLTERLLAAVGHVRAIEKDARLVEVLAHRFAGNQRLELQHADALERLQSGAQDWSGWKLVANLPYSVASPILVELAQAGRGPERMVATLQLEVARRIMAVPGSADYGLLTLLLQLHYEPAGMFKIPASCFFPPPDVDSACITLKRRTQPLLSPVECATFVRLVKRAFSQRRKMMFKLLKADWSEASLSAALDHAGVANTVRAEEVALEQYVQITQQLTRDAHE